MARWREPNLTIHRYKVSGRRILGIKSMQSTQYQFVSSNQEVNDIIKSPVAFLNENFTALDSHNRLSITIDNKLTHGLGQTMRFFRR